MEIEDILNNKKNIHQSVAALKLVFDCVSVFVLALPFASNLFKTPLNQLASCPY